MNNILLEKKYKRAIKNFSEFFKSAKSYEKYKYGYPIRDSGMTRKEARFHGFNFTTYMWKKCKYLGVRNRCNSFLISNHSRQ